MFIKRSPSIEWNLILLLWLYYYITIFLQLNNIVWIFWIPVCILTWLRSRRPNNDRNTKHGRGGRNPPRDGKRAYDRRSGTGRGKEIKKGGGGARNWGSDKADAKKMEGKIDEEAVNEEPPKETEGEEPPVAEEAPVEEEKPEDNTMTFADYMASKGKKEADTGRQVESEFKGVSASKKVEEDFLVMGGGKQKKTKKKKDEQKAVVEVGFRVVSQCNVVSSR